MTIMKRSLLSFFFLLDVIAVFGQSQFTDFVNPIIGTNGMGHTFPGACVPFGAVQLSPDTDTIPHNVNGIYQKNAYEYCAGYQYRDNTIVGFSHTHLSGTGHSDLGDILIMPTTGKLKTNPGTSKEPGSGYRSCFFHTTEKSSLGYYEVMLEDYKIKAQLTATEHAFLHPFVFQDSDNRFRGLDKNIETANGFTNLTVFSLWDTYRALHPLFNLVQREKNADVANSMLAHYDKSVEHMLPIWSFYGNETWCMIGYHEML